MNETIAEVKHYHKPHAVIRLSDFSVEDQELYGTGRIFGRIVETVGPIMKYYHSDLYHDSLFLLKVVEEVLSSTESSEFYWSVNRSGTMITNADQDSLYLHREFCFHIKIWVENDYLYFTMTRMEK